MSTDLTRAISALGEKHLRCRDIGHRWSLKAHHRRVVEWANAYEPVVERIVRCTTCGTTRTEQVRQSDGVMVRRNYRYPDGYQFPAGVAGKGGMAKAPFRLEWVSRLAPAEEDAS